MNPSFLNRLATLFSDSSSPPNKSSPPPCPLLPTACTPSQHSCLQSLNLLRASIEPLFDIVRQAHPHAHWISFSQATAFHDFSSYHAYVYDAEFHKIDVLSLDSSLAPLFKYQLIAHLDQPGWFTLNSSLLDSNLQSFESTPTRIQAKAFKLKT